MNQTIRPLGLPKGSIRAILALIIVTVACQQILTGVKPSLLLAETLMIVLTHYFTTRRHVQITAYMRAKLESLGELEVEENPLWLPRGSVRGLISLAFVITVVLLIGQGRLFDPDVWTILLPFAAYLFGALFGILFRRERAKSSAPPGWFARMFIHLLALFVVFVGITLLFLAFYSNMPDWVASMLLSAILYYFGTR